MANFITRTADFINRKILRRNPPPKQFSFAAGDKNEFKKREDDFAKSPEGKKTLEKMIKDPLGNNIKMKEVYEQAKKKDGPFDNFENLDKNLRNLSATQKMLMVEDYIKNAKDPESLTQTLSDKGFLLDPTLRLGIFNASKSEASFGGKNNEFFKKVDDELGRKAFSNTLEPLNKNEQENYINTFSEKDKKTALDNIEKNKNQQKVMLKMMFMGQLGQASIKQDKDKGAWTNNMTDMFLSGQRVGFVLPGVKGDTTADRDKREEIISAIYGNNRGLDAGNKIRDAATHSVDLKSMDGSKDFNEVKVGPKQMNLHRLAGSHFGMDIAAGGLGKPGAGGAMLNNDGTCGHMYSYIQQGSGKEYGALLVGFESEAPHKTNQLGHTHKASLTPKAELASCFGTQKDNTVGDKYGGREVDMSGMNAGDFLDVMKNFDDYITKNQQKALSDNPVESVEASNNLKKITQKLTGPPMSVDEMSEFMKETCGYDKEKAKDVLSDSRNPEQDKKQKTKNNGGIGDLIDDKELTLDAAKKTGSDKPGLENTAPSKLNPVKAKAPDAVKTAPKLGTRK